MYRIKTLNHISPAGLDHFPRSDYETASEFHDPDGILVRSAQISPEDLNPSLKAIARAGAGVNNISIPECTEKGIVVFNTPGANSNSVKELVVCALFISSRDVFQSMEWVNSIADKGEKIPGLVEKEKSRFAGPEIKGKKLGIIGLGAIGVKVANDASALGMKVFGYDPYISIEAAWGLSRAVERCDGLDRLLAESDYITLHLPLNEHTKNYIDEDAFCKMKRGVRILNFARGGLICTEDLLKALDEGIVAKYVTDFPDQFIVGHKGVIALPHLGSSTPEAEDNCARMAAEQIRDFLETGNIQNSVNFPDCNMAPSSGYRIVIANRNIPNMVGQITTRLAEEKINITNMLNRNRGDIAYNIIDVESELSEGLLKGLSGIDGVLMVRLISGFFAAKKG